MGLIFFLFVIVILANAAWAVFWIRKLRTLLRDTQAVSDRWYKAHSQSLKEACALRVQLEALQPVADMSIATGVELYAMTRKYHEALKKQDEELERIQRQRQVQNSEIDKLKAKLKAKKKSTVKKK